MSNKQVFICFCFNFLLKNYNPNNLKENVPMSKINTSYVEDKGKIFAVCLREKFSGNDIDKYLNDVEPFT